jgi:hypothetical protein
MVTEGSGGAFATLTHARLRAEQGDVAGAVRILRVILEAQPDHGEAREFLAALEHRVAVTYREPDEISAEDVQPSSSGELKQRFREALAGTPVEARTARLTHWIERVRRNRGDRRVR